MAIALRPQICDVTSPYVYSDFCCLKIGDGPPKLGPMRCYIRSNFSRSLLTRLSEIRVPESEDAHLCHRKDLVFTARRSMLARS